MNRRFRNEVQKITNNTISVHQNKCLFYDSVILWKKRRNKPEKTNISICAPMKIFTMPNFAIFFPQRHNWAPLVRFVNLFTVTYTIYNFLLLLINAAASHCFTLLLAAIAITGHCWSSMAIAINMHKHGYVRLAVNGQQQQSHQH